MIRTHRTGLSRLHLKFKCAAGIARDNSAVGERLLRGRGAIKGTCGGAQRATELDTMATARAQLDQVIGRRQIEKKTE